MLQKGTFRNLPTDFYSSMAHLPFAVGMFSFLLSFFDVLKIQRETEASKPLVFPRQNRKEEKIVRHRGRQISNSPIKRDLGPAAEQIVAQAIPY